MWIGIDFGTSYSAAAAIRDGRIIHIGFDGLDQFRTAAYFARDDESDAALGERQREFSARDARTAALFGEPAIDAYLDDPRGQLVQSPKSMLGYRLFPGVAEVLSKIVADILRHMRLTASAQLGEEVRGVVLGRPVNFKSSMPDGNAQACAMLERAAREAGFTSVRFMLEPEAAALDYHRSTPDRRTVLVLDVGGGTTDVCLAQVGGGEVFEPLATWGTGVGGAEVDLWLSLLKFMPHFGRDRVQVSGACFSEAAMVSDVVRQANFRGYDFSQLAEPFRSRLQLLQADGTTVRLARSVERLKIRLSSDAVGSETLDYVEPGLAVHAERADLTRAANYFLVHTGSLLDQVAAQLDQPPRWVVLTGGASAAPYVEEEVRRRFPNAVIARIDPSLGVVSGLAWAAAVQSA